jgi:hypothetical protein
VAGIHDDLFAAMLIDRHDAQAIARLAPLTREVAREGRVLLLMPRNRRGTIAPAKP